MVLLLRTRSLSAVLAHVSKPCQMSSTATVVSDHRGEQHSLQLDSTNCDLRPNQCAVFFVTQGKQKTKKFAAMKRMINLKDHRIKEKDRAKAKEKKKKDPSELKEREVQKYPSCLFFQYNTQLGPPYHVLVDTNFINFSIKAKLDIVQSMMDCLYAKCIPYITDCVMAEIEKLGMKYRVALRIAKDARFERLPCTHKGTYADDCLVQRVTQHKCYILATVDRDLKRRVRKIPGVPIMYISNHRYNIERMPDDYGAPRF
ncbi:hypothetical protein F2P81_003609 [Scophthalmus maximus]|uniref:rRNA-processing protein FCF1 homolog n=1 Tax=Scophthalmus maximus TaxID=52904 RepID=A0A6A4TNV2_SCOMX|nr:hypothetical protein F2P81_003609 [Scophthalmus maximus]